MSEYADDEIDLRELFSVLWEGRALIAGITGLAASLAVVISLLMPNIYHATALLSPTEEQSGGLGGLGALAGQFGGLAGLAGISLPSGGGERAALALEVLKSRKFVADFVKKHDIAPALLATDYWDADTGALVLDTDLYDPKTKKWDETPTAGNIFDAFTGALIVEEDATSGMVTVGFKHKSPTVAQQWTVWAVKELNDAIRNQDIAEAESAIAYLETQVSATSLAELRKLFFELIQKQTETMMLAQVRAEYVFKTVDPAVVPEKKSEPKRALICVLATLLGGMVAVVMVLMRHYLRTEEKSPAY